MATLFKFVGVFCAVVLLGGGWYVPVLVPVAFVLLVVGLGVERWWMSWMGTPPRSRRT